MFKSHSEIAAAQESNFAETLDLAMTRLFGGFEPAFYNAYTEAWPLASGHEDRLPIYQLYHVLNHLNLFGGGYFEQGKRILQHYAR